MGPETTRLKHDVRFEISRSANVCRDNIGFEYSTDAVGRARSRVYTKSVQYAHFTRITVSINGRGTYSCHSTCFRGRRPGDVQYKCISAETVDGSGASRVSLAGHPAPISGRLINTGSVCAHNTRIRGEPEDGRRGRDRGVKLSAC